MQFDVQITRTGPFIQTSRALFEERLVTQLREKFHSLYYTLKFTTVFTKARPQILPELVVSRSQVILGSRTHCPAY
jgi:hypothetical protein